MQQRTYDDQIMGEDKIMASLEMERGVEENRC
jgi:hypothetical protein